MIMVTYVFMCKWTTIILCCIQEAISQIRYTHGTTNAASAILYVRTFVRTDDSLF